jgi:hypothetical protein
MMRWLREDHAAGRISDAELATALQEMTGEGNDQLAPDIRTVEQKEFDKTFPPAKPEQYDFPRTVDPDHITPEVKAFDATARGWLATGLFTREHGSALAHEANRIAAQIEHFSPVEHELFARPERVTLERMWGADTDKNLSIAQAFVREVAEQHPQLIEMLNATGLGNSSSIIVQIFHQAERLMARNMTS